MSNLLEQYINRREEYFSDIYLYFDDVSAPCASKYGSKITVSVLAKQNPLALLASVEKHHMLA